MHRCCSCCSSRRRNHSLRWRDFGIFSSKRICVSAIFRIYSGLDNKDRNEILNSNGIRSNEKKSQNLVTIFTRRFFLIPIESSVRKCLLIVYTSICSGDDESSNSNSDQDDKSIAAEGKFSYVDGDGKTQEVNYKADEDGFQPTQENKN